MSTESQASAERINLVYRSSSPDGSRDVELPFRVLVLGNFSGCEEAEYFGEQQPININLDNFSIVMESLSPQIKLVAPDKLGENQDEVLSFSFVFKNIDDFNPRNLIEQCPELSSLAKLRQSLFDMRESSVSDESLSQYIKELGTESVAGRFVVSMGKDEPLTADILDYCITELDERMGDQLDEILHHADFRAIESIWRGLFFLIERTRFDENCIVEILNLSKTGLVEDLEDAPEIIQSQLYATIYSKEFGQFGGKPYSCFVGSYLFGPSTPDIWLLQQLASIAAMAHAPFIASPSPELFDVDSFSDLVRLRDLAANFEQPRFAKWTSFRQSEDARYVGLVLPGFLLRQPYGQSNPIRIFDYNERFSKKDRGLWGNPAFAFITRLLDSFAETRWCVNVVGSDYGKVSGLTMLGDVKGASREKKIPTEILISDRRETELIRWGFIPLTIHKGEDTAAFYGACSVQAPREFSDTEEGKAAALNFQLGAQLPYLLIVSRLSHYIKMMQREHIGSWKKSQEIELELNNWIKQYITDMDNPAANVRIRRPLRKAKIKVNEVEGKGDWYMISLSVMPHMKYMGSHFTLNENGKLEKN